MHFYATDVVVMVMVDRERSTALVDANVTAKAGRAMVLAASYVDSVERRDGRWGSVQRDVDLHDASLVSRPRTLGPADRFVLDA